jgi:hypothetical protein
MSEVGMGEPIELRCRCGEVRGTATDLSPRTVNRVVCYCDDCQAFAHQLGRTDLLNAKGGSDIVQLAPAALSFTQGQHHIVGLRLRPNGLYRWHTSCCNTPVGNTLTPTIPFVGLLASTFDTPRLDDAVGAPSGEIFGKYAVGEPPSGSTRLNLPLLLRAIGKMLGWRFRGRTWPHPFFSRETGAPLYAVTVLSKEQRDALRSLCGPRPSAASVP